MIGINHRRCRLLAGVAFVLGSGSASGIVAPAAAAERLRHLPEPDGSRPASIDAATGHDPAQEPTQLPASGSPGAPDAVATLPKDGVAAPGVTRPNASVAEPQAASAGDEDVVVTGSRIVRNGNNAPTPTTVLGQEEIQARNPTNIADYVNQLPALGTGNSPRTTTLFANATGGANQLNARDLGVARTLVLLDGRRVVGSGLSPAVDVNLLPQNLVSRVDVVTGGCLGGLWFRCGRRRRQLRPGHRLHRAEGHRQLQRDRSGGRQGRLRRPGLRAPHRRARPPAAERQLLQGRPDRFLLPSARLVSAGTAPADQPRLYRDQRPARPDRPLRCGLQQHTRRRDRLRTVAGDEFPAWRRDRPVRLRADPAGSGAGGRDRRVAARPRYLAAR